MNEGRKERKKGRKEGRKEGRREEGKKGRRSLYYTFICRIA